VTAAEVLPYPPDEPATVTDAAARCDRVAVLAGHLRDDLVRDATRLSAAWQGPAASGCQVELRCVTRLVGQLTAPVRSTAVDLRAYARVVHVGRAEVDALRREYDALLAAHRRQATCLLDEDALTGPLRRVMVEDLLTVQRAELAVVHRRHQEVLDEVAAHARQTGRRAGAAAAALVPAPRQGGAPVADSEGELAGALPMLAAARRAAGVGTSPPAPGTPPELVRRWWAALTTDEQHRAVDSWPTAIGRLDGLPSAVRSAANERRLARDVVLLRGRPTLTADEQRWLDNCEQVQLQLDRVRAVEDPVSSEPMVAQLLVFDPSAFDYQGRAAISVGDVDTADNVAFLVPGLDAEVGDSMAGLTGIALRVNAEARQVASLSTTATVAWMGYDAPGVSGVAFDGAAESGADLLAADVLAVQASRDVLPHLTVIGHSYGGTTAGTALRDHETGTDDVVLVGSPGANVEQADDLHVPEGHVFVGASSRDPVSYLDWFGADPAEAPFGAVRFEAEDPSRNSWREDVDDHSKYFDAGTESLSNIVHVVTGDYADVVPAPSRHDVFLLPDGINSDPESDREPTTVP
jgi:hypothetical protein